MKIKRLYGCNTSFLDLLFNMLLAFTALFILAFAMISQNKEQNKTNTESKAEYILTFSWPDDFDNDIDVYVEDPDGHLVFFQRREDGLMHLDRDDLGARNDIISTPTGTIKYPFNREMVTLRGTVEGEYCVNVHAYRSNDPRPCLVTVQLDKLNPIFKTILAREVVLLQSRDEKTVFRFKLNKKGDVISTNFIDKSLLKWNAPPQYQAPGYNSDGNLEPEPEPEPNSEFPPSTPPQPES